jgi:hypothetical protein
MSSCRLRFSGASGDVLQHTCSPLAAHRLPVHTNTCAPARRSSSVRCAAQRYLARARRSWRQRQRKRRRSIGRTPSAHS